MYWQYDMSKAEEQAGRQLSATLAQQLVSFLDPLLEELDTFIDKRLIRTLLDTVIAILLFRDRAKNLLLSKLGAYIANPSHAPASTKRLSNEARGLWAGIAVSSSSFCGSRLPTVCRRWNSWKRQRW